MRNLVGERGALEIYWANQKMLPHWHRFPWASFVDKSPNLSIPIRLHGDDAPHLSQGGAFMSVNFCSCVVNEGPVTDRKHLIGVVGLPGLAPDALQTWFDPVVESFWDAGSGSTDCPYRVFFTELVSDWKFKREILNLPYHYNCSKALCHECVLDKKKYQIRVALCSCTTYGILLSVLFFNFCLYGVGCLGMPASDRIQYGVMQSNLGTT